MDIRVKVEIYEIIVQSVLERTISPPLTDCESVLIRTVSPLGTYSNNNEITT